MNVLLRYAITKRKPETEALTTPVDEEKLSALLIQAHAAATDQTEPGHTRLAFAQAEDIMFGVQSQIPHRVLSAPPNQRVADQP
jgi:hypothetical protein